MLIDISGHVKLTDFGLSKSGFLGRRAIGVGDVGGKPPRSSPDLMVGEGLYQISPFKNITTNRRDSIASISSNDSVVFGSRITEKLEEKQPKKLVGTPDYLAPESILGLGQGISVDWVNIQVI
jgi:serine/threonine protein kinase